MPWNFVGTWIKCRLIFDKISKKQGSCIGNFLKLSCILENQYNHPFFESCFFWYMRSLFKKLTSFDILWSTKCCVSKSCNFSNFETPSDQLARLNLMNSQLHIRSRGCLQSYLNKYVVSTTNSRATNETRDFPWGSMTHGVTYFHSSRKMSSLRTLKVQHEKTVNHYY